MIFSLEGSLSLYTHINNTTTTPTSSNLGGHNSDHSPHLIIHGLDNSYGKFPEDSSANFTR